MLSGPLSQHCVKPNLTIPLGSAVVGVGVEGAHCWWNLDKTTHVSPPSQPVSFLPSGHFAACHAHELASHHESQS